MSTQNLIKFTRLKEIYFDRKFNQEIKGVIPNFVSHLCFGNNFNQEIKEAIPDSVTHLIFGWYFNEEIKGAIPNSVIYLEIPKNFDNKKKIDDISNSMPNLKIYTFYWIVIHARWKLYQLKYVLSF